MSASLVGSEMCIRDRRHATRISRREHVRTSGHQRVRTSGCQETSCPVSYTHLTLPTICSV
eukprot:445154-Alexandrium_andersonii.AAC.1